MDDEGAVKFANVEAKIEAVKPVKSKNGHVVNSYDDFRKLAEERREQCSKVALFSHPSLDPDAIASMMGVAWILFKEFDLEADLFYSGEVSHPQNNSMVNLLTPDLQRIEEYSEETAYCLRILVDTVPDYAGVGECKDLKFDVVIDHHRDQPTNFHGLVIHQKAGSCASIIYDMMEKLVSKEDWLDDEVDVDTKLATGLIAGIMTDTHFMMSDDCTESDRCAFNGLFEYRNAGFLNQIVFFKRRKFWIAKKAEACARASVDEEGVAVVGLGLIPERERDLISDMAEEMSSWASVETAIAFGVVGGDRIEGSVRSLNASLIVADFCKSLGGRYGSGGGKHGKGAYQLPLAGFSIDADEDEEDAQEAWESIRKRESKRITRITKK